MQLTRHTDYAFRALIYLASMPNSTATIGTISETFGIPKSHLMKVISSLSAHGYVISTRGKSGGISLLKSAEEITLREIVMLMEKTLVPFDCIGQNCLILNSCRLNRAFLEAQKKYLESLESYTIADMLNNETIITIHGKASV
ncbi:Rrf2 family transcriptional regulator [Thiomicrorhabdus sp.]|uniref:RrF2 family transcriptional regulator n=1 Tax=Thiomicrorhabdus sp. TaxID=2039724 RepID=UPI0029C9323A|nr:Rrf2 family transcriptional regulator [Thiomicrorhabdus sp.]